MISSTFMLLLFFAFQREIEPIFGKPRIGAKYLRGQLVYFNNWCFSVCYAAVFNVKVNNILHSRMYEQYSNDVQKYKLFCEQFEKFEKLAKAIIV